MSECELGTLSDYDIYRKIFIYIYRYVTKNKMIKKKKNKLISI